MNKKYFTLLSVCSGFVLVINIWPDLIWQFIPAKTEQKTENKPAVPTIDLLKEIETLKKRPFDEAAFELSFKTLLFNSKIKEAYLLAQIAVEKKPSSLFWHENLAQTATWAGDYNTAMQEWLYVAQNTDNSKTMLNAADIATVLGYSGVTAQILTIYYQHHPDAVREVIALANAENQVNRPEKALQLLDQINRTHPTREGYELTAAIYQDINQWENALTTWQQTDKRFGASVKSALAQAQIHYSINQFPQALDSLKPAIPKAKANDTDFWRNLSSLALMLNDHALAVEGLSHLQDQPNDLYLLITLKNDANPEQALQYSIQGWNRFHTLEFAQYALSLATQLTQWEAVYSVMQSLTPEQEKELKKNSGFWEQKGAMYAALGRQDLQMELLIQGISEHPSMAQLRTALLFILVNQGNLRWVKALMEDGYENNIWDDPVSWKVYADTFVVLNQLYAALTMYQENIFQNLDYDQLLIDYGNFLKQARLYQQAQNLWDYLWNRTIHQYQQEPVFSKKLARTLAQLSVYFTSGTEQVSLLNALFSPKAELEDINILLNWMVPRNYFELITYFKSFYLDNILPVWAGSNLALAHNDLPTLQHTIENADTSWSRADLINVAVRLENIPLALDLGFHELSERPNATEIYTEFTQYGVAETNFLSLGEEYEKFVNVGGPHTYGEGRFRLTNSWKLQSNFSLWRVHSMQPEFITNVPKEDAQGHLRFNQKIFHGTLRYSVGYRSDLGDFVPASIDMQYQIAPKWSALVKFGYNQESYQNAYLREGGVQDQVNLGVIGNVSRYDSLQFELQGLGYYSQNRHYLADGAIISGLYEHKFWLSYPDYTLGLFGNIYLFDRNGSYGGDVTTLFPAPPPDIAADPVQLAVLYDSYYQQLIPNSYSEGGLTFSFGNNILDYTHVWRPYFWSRLYYNTITLVSYDLKLGINGTVFGKDSLLIYAERGTSQTTQSQTNYSFGMRYKLYY